MYSDLKGKTALVTGSGKKTGIGYAIVRSLAASGVDVIIADLGQDPSGDDIIKTGTLDEMESIVREIQEEFSVSALAVGVDVTDNDAIGG